MTFLSGMRSKNKNLAAIVVKVFLKFLKIILKRVPIYNFSKTCFVYMANKLKNRVRRISH